MTLAKERIVNVLKQIVPDQDAEEIVFYLQGKENISEFIIAEELDLEIHRTRNLLYRLLDSNVVSFKRKKDKIKGWYICYWDFNEPAISHLEEKLRLETIAKLRARLETERGGFFYMCRHAHVRQNFENAFEDDFKCPECGELMNQQDNARTISFLNERIANLEKEQAVFAKERAVFLKEASKKAEQEIKEALESGEKKWDKKSTARAIKQSTKSVAEKAELTKVAKAAARKVTVKKATKKKTTKKKVTKKKATTQKTQSNTTPRSGVNKVAGAPKRKVSSESAQAPKVARAKKAAKPAPKKTSTPKKSVQAPKVARAKKVAKPAVKKATKKKVAKPVKTKKSGFVNKIAKRIGVKSK